MTKNTQQTRNRRKLSQHNKNHVPNTYATADVMLSGERRKVFPWERARCPLLPLLSNRVLIILARPIWTEKNKRHSNWKERSKIISVLRWHDLTCSLKNFIHTHLLELIKRISCRIQNQHIILYYSLLYTQIMNNQEEITKKQVHLQ